MTAWVTAVVLFVEAFGVVLLNIALGKVVDNQSMSLAGVDSGLMANSTYVLAGICGLYLLLCALVALLCALRHRSPGRVGRILLITCAVVHGVLGALTVGLVGWGAFVFMMVVLALIVLTLLTHERETPTDRAAPAGPADAPTTPMTP
ncbi:hypothetical protein [Streptomyces tsukubensis]|uniref:hypothetical protein n=1 Tax=Streptomyces tsukubensis TaxID=83656 RepID=UPI001D042B95|nr:hypothetical protein [Streptomyces tsukubensis]